MSAEIFGFRGGPTYRGASPVEQFDAAMAAPMSLTSTFFDQAKGGILESFGLGTAVRSAQLPAEAPTAPGLALTRPDGSVLTLPDTPNMRRRQVVQGVQVPRETPQQFEQRRTDAGALSEDAYKSSPYFRSNIPWDAGMTDDRAAALAMMDDAKKVREFYAEKRPITAFIGNLAGQALDPVNYIPVTGPAVRAAAAARFGRIGGAAVAGALDAAGNTALAAVATQDTRATFGDDVSWQSTVSQIATAALIGGAFGTIGGAFGARSDARTRRMAEERIATLKTTQEARIALNEGIDALANGRDVALSPNALEPVVKAARNVETLNPLGARAEAAVDGIASIPEADARAALVSANYDIKALEASGQDVSAVMGSAPLEDAGKAVQRQQISSISARLESLKAEQPVPNSYGPGLRLTDKAPAEEMVYDTGMGGAAMKQERDALIEAETVKLAEIQAADASGTVLPSILDSLRLGRSINPVGRSASPRGIDNSLPRPEPIPAGRAQAESRIAKPDDYKALAAQYGVDPQNGSFTEEGDIAQLAVEGRLTEDDAVVLADAQATFEDGAAYGEALKSVASCLI